MTDYCYIGIDVGTTEIKCCAMRDDRVIAERRCDTPSTLFRENAVFVEPESIWNNIRKLLGAISLSVNDSRCCVSVVCQAPTLCFWDDTGFSIGISYLSYYGDPTCNSKMERVTKTAKRAKALTAELNASNNVTISGLTGFLVYKLTGVCSLDGITAWEIGIESKDDVPFIESEIGIKCFPPIYAPIHVFKMDCVELSLAGLVLAGATDSAVLPLSTNPPFNDYYIYLGTWGSLLQTKIENSVCYSSQYFCGEVHRWLISTPNFIEKCIEDKSELNEFFRKASQVVPPQGTIAVCGGLLKAFRADVLELCKTYFAGKNTTFAPDISTAFASAKLARIALEVK